MGKIKTTKVILWLLTLLLLFLSCYVYTGFYGTPWEKYHQENSMKTYLTDKYATDFVIKNTKYNQLSGTYQSYAFPKEHPELLFFVEQDHDSKAGYSDTYPKVYWGSVLSNGLKAKIKSLFPRVDVSTISVLQIVERGKYFSPATPTYDEAHVSNLACSISINIQTNWQLMNQDTELKKMKMLSQYLKTTHFPVLIEIHYYEKQLHNNEKVYLITEDGKIVYQ